MYTAGECDSYHERASDQALDLDIASCECFLDLSCNSAKLKLARAAEIVHENHNPVVFTRERNEGAIGIRG